MNRIVGIMPTININKDDNPYNDNYSFVDLYAKKVFECNGIPYGILLNNGEIDYQSLNMCDGFIIPGGRQSYISHIKKSPVKSTFLCINSLKKYQFLHNSLTKLLCRNCAEQIKSIYRLCSYICYFLCQL
jgi:gamma-glutamyl-gamma-aminobutyrate hydrolase PuuD